MSTAIIKAEIERFLQSPDPEVLCISGKWGVGKTFAFQRYLGAIESSGSLALRRYAYVSLFGLNSLAELRNSVTENTVQTKNHLSSPDIWSFSAMLREGEAYVRKSRPILDIAAGAFRMKDAGDALYRAAFLMVKEQLICFDDLERAGKGLEMRDIMGLASMLREQRSCKIVLLLNDQQAEEAQKKELSRQLEKVVDTFLVFEPTSAEAADIAIVTQDDTSTTLRARFVALGITNIRVMKKIERWVRQIETALAGRSRQTIDQAISTATLAGWSFLQPDDAPSLDYLETFNPYSGMFSKNEGVDPVENKWKIRVKEYGYTSTDELDASIILGIRLGYFQSEILAQHAASVEAKHSDRGNRGSDSFSRAWEMYHSNFTVDDDAILDAMYQGALDNLTTVSTANMNAAIKFLRRHGRDPQASNLVKLFVDANKTKPDFFSKSERMFFDTPADDELLNALEAGRMAIVYSQDPVDRLKVIAEAKGFNPPDDIALLDKLTSNDFLSIFDNNSGPDLKSLVEWSMRIGAQPGAEQLRGKVIRAIEIIAKRSPMRAERLRNWGVLPATTPASPASVKPRKNRSRALRLKCQAIKRGRTMLTNAPKRRASRS